MKSKSWNTMKLKKDFEVLAFFPPFVAVRRRKDGKYGTMRFDDYPRKYYNFEKANYYNRGR